MKKILLTAGLLLGLQTIYSQVLLDADGDVSNTYDLITSVLAPDAEPIEVPDCNHEDFGDHIDQVMDDELGINVFRFFIHTTPDNDRCINLDRQRNEIKSYSQSPENLLGKEGETVEYKWKVKLSDDFQPSSAFTHLHQLKGVGSQFEAVPVITLTARKGSPDKLELRYGETSSQTTLEKIDLDPFKGEWVEIVENVTYDFEGSYSLKITKVSDGTVLWDYSDDDIVMWREGSEFIRPKWGIYRSLDDAESLKDESVLYANFSIEEIGGSDVVTSVDELSRAGKIRVIPTPSSDNVTLAGLNPQQVDQIQVYDSRGLTVATMDFPTEGNINVANWKSGIYFIVLSKKGTIIDKLKLIKDNN